MKAQCQSRRHVGRKGRVTDTWGRRGVGYPECHGAVDVQAPKPRVCLEKAQRPGEYIVGNTNFLYKVSAADFGQNFQPATSCAAPSLPALFLLIYDKPDLVFLSRSPFLPTRAHPFPLASVLHNIGTLIFGPLAFPLLDTDRPP